jgi:membrane protein DedA with SNARE-associated domain
MADILDAISTWVGTMPIGALYALLGLAAFIEGIFPPVPADLVVALGSFLAARRGASLTVTTACIVTGSVGGAMVVYAIVRKFGAGWLHARLRKAGVDDVEKRLEGMYSHYGMTALFVSRFLPVFRAVAPPMAGAMRIPPVRTAGVFVLASAIWYGAIAWIAFRVGDDWAVMQASVRHFARRVGVVALVAAVLFAVIVFIIVRKRAAERLAEVMAEEETGESPVVPSDEPTGPPGQGHH